MPHRQEEVIGKAFQGAGVHHFHLDLADQPLPLARAVDNEVGAHLTRVLGDGLRLLGEVQLGPGEDMGNGGEIAVPYPGRREVGDKVVGLVQGVAVDEPTGGGYQGAVGEHGPLGQTGGAGGVVDEGHVVAAARRHVRFVLAGVRPLVLPPQGEHLVEADDNGVVVVAEALGVPVDDLLQQGQPVLDFQELIGLLLVVDDGELGTGVLGDVFHLRGDGIDEDAGGDAPRRLDGELPPEPGRLVVPDDAGHVAALQAQADEPQGEVFHALVIVLPAVAAPDAEHLHGHGGAVAPPVAVAAD